MNVESACKIVAFYNGYRDAYNPCDNSFENNINLKEYLDLNQLVKVWEKMQNFGVNLRFDKGEWAGSNHYFLIDSVNDEYGRKFPTEGVNLSENLVIATAEAIIELGKDA